METAYAYARVSTKEQAAKENSIPAQFKRIEEYCKEKDIQIIKRYFDSESAYNDLKRDQFYQMVNDAIDEYPTYIITDDSSRFARKKDIAVEVKNRLRNYGIDIRFANEPYIDPDTLEGFWIEGIKELMNETSSRQTSFHVTKGMNYNIQNRDKETGWCYKNGGTTPFGYKLERLIKSKDSDVNKVLKSIWLIDEEQSKIIREILIEMRLNKRMTYTEIRDELNKRNIKTNRNGAWSTTSISELFKKHRLMIYSGFAVWNKTNAKVKNRPTKSEEDWLVVENAHEAIISEQEMEALLDTQKRVTRDAKVGRSRGSRFLFTGHNYENDKMFVCARCGSAMVGEQNAKANYYKYACGSYKNKGKTVCTNDAKIKRQWIEELLIDEIAKRYTEPDSIKSMINTIDKNVNSKNELIDLEIAKHNRELAKVNHAINNMVEAIKSGVDASLMTEEINSAREEQTLIKRRINDLKREYTTKKVIDKQDLKLFLLDFRNLFNNAEQEQKRELVRTFIRQIILNPDEEEITVEYHDNSALQTIRYGEPYTWSTKMNRDEIKVGVCR